MVSDSRARGIVLKSYLPRKQKYLLLDRDQGPIEMVPTSQEQMQRLCNGAVVTYHIREQRSVFLLDSVDILHVPFAWARHDILFLHHLLELATFFVHPGAPAPDVFDLLQTVYTSPLRSSKLFKKLVVARFFLSLGSWPETDLWENPEMVRALGVIGKGEDFGYTGATLGSAESHEAQSRELESILEKLTNASGQGSVTLDEWLLACVREHPHQAMLNTVHFLSGTYE